MVDVDADVLVADRSRVLVVDDEDSARTCVGRALEDAGYEVVAAATAREGLRQAALAAFDLVLLELRLPDLDGLEVVRRLRDDPRTADVPVIVTSADPTVETRVDGLAQGADDYLTKPVAQPELVARVRAAVQVRTRFRARLEGSLAARRRQARALAELDPTTPLPALLHQLRDRLAAELPFVSFAVRLTIPGEVADPVDERSHLERRPWPPGPDLDGTVLEHRDDRAVVHTPLRTSGPPFAVLSLEPLGDPERTMATMIDLAPQISALLAPAVATDVEHRSDRRAIRRLVTTDAVMPVYQPIVDLADGAVVGFEGLSRFADGTPPDRHFARAARLGLGGLLELHAAERIVAGAPALPTGTWLSFNLSAPTLLTSELAPLLAHTGRDVRLEITEHERIADYAEVTAAIGRLPGVGLSVDDAGSGYASLRHIYELRPATIKLDRVWADGIDTDPVKRAMVTGLCSIATSIGADLVAEGIEREEQRSAFADLGVPLGQGFLLGRPATADDLAERPI